MTIDLLTPLGKKNRDLELTVSYVKLTASDLASVFIRDDIQGVDRNPKNIAELKQASTGIIRGLTDIKKDLIVKINVKPNKKLQQFYEKLGVKQIKDSLLVNSLKAHAVKTDKGTLLIMKNRVIEIGNVDFEFFYVVDRQNETIPIWIKNVSGNISSFLKYGSKLTTDGRYHGLAKYKIDLPKTKLLSFLACIKRGNYTLYVASDAIVKNEVRVK